MTGLFESLYIWIRESSGSEALAFLSTAAIIFVGTFILTWIVTKILRKYLTRDKAALPSMSIYLNIARFACWALGISIFLSTCCGINVSAFVAALGVAGIAISLGFKDTVTNLISGVQVTSMKIMEPGEHIQVGDLTGIVIDTNWRHTKIRNMGGDVVIVPNSVINARAIIKRKPFNHVRVHVYPSPKSLFFTDQTQVKSLIKQAIEGEVNESGERKFGDLHDDVSISFSSISEDGAKGTISVVMDGEVSGPQAVQIKDLIVRTVAPFMNE